MSLHVKAKPYRWLEPCKSCGRKHYMAWLPCPSCRGAYSTPQPAFAGVQESCGHIYECDGCEAYREHLAW